MTADLSVSAAAAPTAAPTPTPSTPTPPSLRRARVSVDPALRAAVERLDATNRALSAYHLGWSNSDGTPSCGGGKGLRPALALISAQAVGAACEVAVPGAVAVELVHNFSLLHDDVMDGDTHRRHRKTVWALWGVPSAILTGDALLGLAVEVLLDAGSPRRAAAARLITSATRELIRGQTQDLAFERRIEVGVEECLAMVRDKTGALLAAASTIGAVLAGGPPEVVEALREYGMQLGVAFQLVDDLLGIWGDPARTGKPVYSDLRATKKSLPVAYALGRGGAASRRLARWLAEPSQRVEEQLPHAAALVSEAGGRRWAIAEARRRLDAALAALDHPARTHPLADAARQQLIEIAHFAVDREL